VFYTFVFLLIRIAAVHFLIISCFPATGNKAMITGRSWQILQDYCVKITGQT